MKIFPPYYSAAYFHCISRSVFQLYYSEAYFKKKLVFNLKIKEHELFWSNFMVYQLAGTDLCCLPVNKPCIKKN